MVNDIKSKILARAYGKIKCHKKIYSIVNCHNNSNKSIITTCITYMLYNDFDTYPLFTHPIVVLSKCGICKAGFLWD